MMAPELGGPISANKLKATNLFMGLLTFSQIGAIDMNQDFEGKQSYRDM